MKSRELGSIVAVVCAAFVAVVLTAFPSFAVETVYPLERARHLVVTRAWPLFAGLFGGASAQAENDRLRREVAELSLLRAENERLRAENERLRKSLDYRARNPGRWLVADVLSRDGAAAGVRRFLRVGKGSLAGVRAGAVVVVPEGLVGRVTKVTPHTAEVMLVTDPSIKVSCVVKSGEAVRATGILSGGSDERLLLRHLGSATELPAQSRVLTSGLGGVFPPGLAVGTLLDVRTDPEGLSQEGEVLPPVDYSALEDVFIRCES